MDGELGRSVIFFDKWLIQSFVGEHLLCEMWMTGIGDECWDVVWERWMMGLVIGQLEVQKRTSLMCFSYFA